MKTVGITYRSSKPLYSGMNMTAFQLMEIYTCLEQRVTMIDIDNEDDYVPPFFSLSQISKVEWTQSFRTKGLDYLIDVDATMTHQDRERIASQSIVFLRSFLQFTELEKSAYIEAEYVPRDLEGVSEVWCWDIMNPEDTIPSIELLFPCRVRRMPFAWSNMVIKYVQEHNNHDSQYVSDMIWTVHVSEKNQGNQSTSVLPMVAAKELFQKKVIHAQYMIHGMDHIKDNRFLKENVLVNIESDKLPLQMVPSTSYSNWLSVPNQVLFSHIRFQPIRLATLNAIWLGIPLIHNSPVLRDAHPLLKELYYTGNDIHEISDVFGRFVSNPVTLWYNAIPELRTWLEDIYSWKRHMNIWQETIGEQTSLPTTTIEKQVTVNELVIAFSDMWPGFNVEHNYIMDAMRHEFPSVAIKGIQYSSDIHTTIHLLIFGPYGEVWKSAKPSIPRVYFSAENWTQPDDSSIRCYLTPSRTEDARHIRLATWAMFIDWFSNATTLPSDTITDNPIRLPLHFAMNTHSQEWSTRPNWCAFVVSNPVCEFRNQTFHAMNTYKPVTSGGALYNNIGGQLSLKYPGGGCGDISKHHFFVNHKYTISFENSQASGYVTEKLLHAKMAGCVPLYWGDQEAHLDFVPESFINLSAVKDPHLVVEVMKKLEANPAMCAKMAATPLLNEEKKQQALRSMSKMCQRLMELIHENVKPVEIDRIPDVSPLVTMNGPTDIKHTYVVNLDSRPDRWESLLKAEPWIETNAERISAVNGKHLQLTQVIYELFEHNQFNWKKSVMGCSLSHIKLWSKIAGSDTLDLSDKIMILEDDVRFMPNWRQEWEKAVKCIPEDADLLYIGGVLPPNKPALPHILDSVNSSWARIRPNRLFTPIDLPVFHFCTYSYVITPRGAQKLIVGIMESKQKAAVAIDHILGSPAYQLNTYVATPLLTVCFQEDDPAYIQSNFNQSDPNHVFDSDIRNQTDVFTESDLLSFRMMKPSMTIYYRQDTDHPFDLYERSWLEFVTQKSIVCKPYCMGDQPPEDNAWYVVQRPYSEMWSQLFHTWNKQNISFRVLHLSDEFTTDTIDFYSLSMCKAVIRNYPRADISSLSHIVTIPLGYHHKPDQDIQPKTWEERTLLWTFHGTDWFDRGQQLTKLESYVPNSCRLLPSWNHPDMTGPHDYIRLLQNSKFCPVLKGNNDETFRLYEALEAGCLPITFITNHNYLSWVNEHLHLEDLYPWNKPEEALKNEALLGEYTRTAVQIRWSQWKAQIQSQCQVLVNGL